ncbi:MAG: ribosomal protein S18-alanine N-acetyltransferase [Ectothiorhodospiraceae bacterium]|jgi:ribosomal-protein-alanine N-acetyltransferase
MIANASSFLSIIRPMRDTDVAAVADIEEAAYDFPWSPGIFRDCLRMGYDCAVHLAEDRVVGYVVMSFGGGEAHILNIAVAPDVHHRGFGRRLLRRAIRQARRLGAQDMFLEVRPSNTAALALYRDEGFHVVGRRRHYYPTESGREDAMVLRLDLPDVRDEQ